MSYPTSPFSADFNDDILVPPSCYIQNRDSILRGLKMWLCQTPSVTTIRINPSAPTVEKLVKGQLDKNYAHRNVPVPKVYRHKSLDILIVEHVSVNYLDLKQVNKEVIVDCKCGAAVLRGAHVFAAGVIGMTKDCHFGDKVSIYADTNLHNKCKKGFAKVWESPSKHFIANGRVVLTRSELFRWEPIKIGIAIEVTDTISGCPPLDRTLLHKQSAMLQNLPSVVAVECLDVPKHARILDMCASPGGKTVHIAAQWNSSKPGSILMACDKTPHKILQLKRTCEKYLVENIRIGCVDWLNTTQSFEPFDAILLDAPCSATGNRPQLAVSNSEKVLESFVAVQKKLISVAAGMLRPGGTLVYSTCSIAVPENEGIVAYALRKLPLELVPAEPKHGFDAFPCEGVESPEYLQRFGPTFAYSREGSDACNSIGFFIAKFTKKESN